MNVHVSLFAMVDLTFDVFKVVVFKEKVEFSFEVGKETGFGDTFLHGAREEEKFFKLRFVNFEGGEALNRGKERRVLECQ